MRASHSVKKAASPPTILTLFSACAVAHAQAQTVFSRTGSSESAFALSTYPFDTFNNQTLSATLAETTGFSNAVITARLTDFGIPTTGAAYLTTRIGPTASTADLVATFDVAFPASGADVTLFSGLSLLPNTTYYLTISSDSVINGIWYGTGTPTVQTAPGVRDNGSYCTHDLSAFPPSEAFISSPGLGLEYTVAVPAPETSTAASLGLLLAPGFGGLAVAGCRRGAARRSNQAVP